MPIPHQENPLDALGLAAYLVLQTSTSYGSGHVTQQLYQGTLFVINARGEPMEFTYNRLATSYPQLWGGDRPPRHAERKLTASLLTACPRMPELLLYRLPEASPELFTEEIHLSIPVGRLSGTPDKTEVTWLPEIADSLAEKLWQHLQRYGLVWEPFTRAEIGLKEIYPT